MSTRITFIRSFLHIYSSLIDHCLLLHPCLVGVLAEFSICCIALSCILMVWYEAQQSSTYKPAALEVWIPEWVVYINVGSSTCDFDLWVLLNIDHVSPRIYCAWLWISFNKGCSTSSHLMVMIWHVKSVWCFFCLQPGVRCFDLIAFLHWRCLGDARWTSFILMRGALKPRQGKQY